MEQEELNRVVAENLVKYRRASGKTQAELAEILNYSDKSVSKWEQGNGMPDVYVLQKLAEIYGITVNDFLCEHEKEVQAPATKRDHINHLMIMLMSSGLCWLVAVVFYVFLRIFKVEPSGAALTFIYAIPAMSIVLLVFSCIWKYYCLRAVTASAVIWTTILAIFMTVKNFSDGAGLLFLIGIPLQILLSLWFLFRSRKHRKERENKKQ